jgi:hypothetical protein
MYLPSSTVWEAYTANARQVTLSDGRPDRKKDGGT